MTRSSTTRIVLILSVLAILFALFRAGASYRSPLLPGEERTAFETAADFFLYSWHYSREVWFWRSRNWPAMARARLLGFQHRPDHPIYSDLRDLSLFELGRAYERAGLSDRAAGIYLRARREDPENLWLRKWVDDKLREFNRKNNLKETKNHPL